MFRANKSSLVAVPFFSLLALMTACGSPPPPATPAPEEPAKTDMPAPAPTVAADTPAPAEATPAVPDPAAAAPATLALPTATAKIAVKGKKAGNVELKSDGSVMGGGKALGKISGMALQNSEGKSLLTVGSDGAVAADGGAAYGSFTGDELTLAKGDKVGMADDGTVTMTAAGGKSSVLGKFENAASSKRAAVLAVAVFVAPPAAEKAAKPAAKPAAEKHAAEKHDAKPAAKPAAKPKK